MILKLIVVGVLGLLAGGVVNALADDLPQRLRPSLPHYPDHSRRPLAAWLGILAFVTGRRASSTGSRLSWRYPVTELGTAALMLLTVIVTENDPQVSNLQQIFYLIYMAIFALIAVIDIEHRLILFVVVIPSAAVALLDALLTPVNHKPDIGTALVGGLLGFGVFFVLYLGGILFSYGMAKMRGYELPEVAFGYGDVMLSTLCGLILGWQSMVIAMFVTVFLGALGAVIYLLVRGMAGRRYQMFTPLPYGPYILIGTLLLLLFSDGVRQFIWSVA
ncbi:MAG: A24 family peptidase [Anaerolineae bacterium]|nr:A24 family peptidase [Anaerolineae bacterium]